MAIGPAGSIAKRMLDLVGAVSGILVLSPMLMAVLIALRIRLGKPVFFRQTRPGFRGEPFVLLKFRTMAERRDAQGQLLPDSERLTGLGSFLRRSSLDEFPELLNVLRGDMSLVGPRPLLTEYLDRYTPEQSRRHDVKPGLTGWAQINGRNAISWEEKFRLDVWYVDHWSLWLDLKILILTVWKVLRREGITADSHATMPAFLGSTSSDSPQQASK